MTSALAACDDPFEALLLDVPDSPVEISLVDFLTGPLQQPSAFDVIFSRAARVDQTNQWDFLYFVTPEGTHQLVPFGALADSLTDSGLQQVSESFEGLGEAPAEDYTIDAPVPISEGNVLAVRSRADPNSFIVCRRYAKIEILEIDAAENRLTFRALANPNCEDFVLIPGQHGTF
jgi:hypothetical protein